MTVTAPESSCTVEALAGVVDELQRVVGGLDASVLSTGEAAELLGQLARAERLAAGGRTVVAERAAASDRWRTEGQKSPEDWLARQTGGSKTDARRALRTSRRLRTLDATRDAMARGELSTRQTEAVVAAAVADPKAEGELLSSAARNPLSVLNEDAARVRAAADRDPEATRRRHHRQRAVRFWDDPDGSRCASVRGPRDQMARVQAVLDGELDDRLARARDEGAREGLEAYAYDAFLAALGLDPALTVEGERERGGEPGPRVGRGPKHPRRDTLVVHATLPVLFGGGPADGDFCEIPGIGPYPLAAARDLLWGDTAVHLVIHHGADVANVVTNTRAVRASIRTATLARDRGRCVVPGCGRPAVEIHHLGGANGFATTGVTALDLLASLCAHHHDDLTHRGADLAGSHRRGWQWTPPPPDRAHPQGRPSPTRRRDERVRRRRRRSG